MGRPTLEELRKIAMDAIIRPAIEKKKTSTESSSSSSTASYFWERVGMGSESVTEQAATPADNKSAVTVARDPFLLSDLNTRDIVYQDILEEEEEMETTTFNVTRAGEDEEEGKWELVVEEERVQAVYAETSTTAAVQEDQTETSR